MKLRLALLFALLAVIFAPAASAIEVEASGAAAIFSGNVASARTQAIANAQRNAVEQGVGALVDSRTASENFQIIRDEVLTSSQGFVSSYKILSEGKTRDGNSFEVKIRATVSKELLEDRLTALRILHKQMGNKRVMVIYQSDNPNALRRNHGATTAALQTINNEFNSAGFRLFNQGATDRVYKQIEQAARVDRPVDDIIAMALDQEADMVVRFENIAGQRGPQGGRFSAAYSTIRISVYDTNTGRQIADAQVEGKQLLRANAGPYDWEKGLADAATQAAGKASKETIDRIIDYYKQLGDQGAALLLVFKGFNDDQKDSILTFLENAPGVQQMSELKNTVGYLEVELFSGESPSRLRRVIRAGLKDRGIELQTQAGTGNRIIFANPQRPE